MVASCEIPGNEIYASTLAAVRDDLGYASVEAKKDTKKKINRQAACTFEYAYLRLPTSGI